MKDDHFEPDRIEVDRGETIVFRFINRGGRRHDAFIGNEQEQDLHEQEVRKMKRHHGRTDETVTLDPGEMATVKRTFDESGTTLIGCHELGQYDDGMVASIRVR